MNSLNKRKTAFLHKAELVHGTKYDYSKVNYTYARDKVIIICPLHGEFVKTPNKHLGGQGCPECSNEKIAAERTKPFKVFKDQASKLYGNHYTYIESTYTNAKDTMTIVCNVHGEFAQTPDKHLNRALGCPVCRKADVKPAKSTERFITEARQVHGDLYDYTDTVYCKAHENIIIVCHKHGKFEQTPSNHLAGKGCRRCTVTGGGFDASKAGVLYYIEIDKGAYYKIGITNRTVWDRFSKDEHHRIRIVKEWCYPCGRDAQLNETKVLQEHKSSLIPEGTRVLRNGNTEVFSDDVLGLAY